MTEELRPFSEWNEDHGDVLWWKFPIVEPPHVGKPTDLGFQVAARLYNQFGEEIGCTHSLVGGWPFQCSADRLFWQAIKVPMMPPPKDHEPSNPYCVCSDCIPF